MLALSLLLLLVAGAAAKPARKPAPTPPARAEPATRPVQVTKNAPTVEEKLLDPLNPPPEMVRIAPGHLAFAHCYYSLSSYMHDNLVGNPRRTSDTFTAEIKLERIDVTLDLKTTIWLPAEPAAYLREHEMGHRQLGERMYETADADAKRFATPWIGRTVSGRGATIEEARQAARYKVGDDLAKKYVAYMVEEGQKLHDLYDKITVHGTEKIAVDEAVEQAFKQWSAEQKRAAAAPKLKPTTRPAGR